MACQNGVSELAIASCDSAMGGGAGGTYAHGRLGLPLGGRIFVLGKPSDLALHAARTSDRDASTPRLSSPALRAVAGDALLWLLINVVRVAFFIPTGKLRRGRCGLAVGGKSERRVSRRDAFGPDAISTPPRGVGSQSLLLFIARTRAAPG